MRDSGYIVEHYMMIHSKWSDENPVYGQRCSSIRINGTEGYWFSTNCSEKFTSICKDVFKHEDMFIIPKIPRLTTETPKITETPTNSTFITGKQHFISAEV